MRDNACMSFVDRLVIVFAKFFSFVSTTLGIGAGATWPGEIALMLRPNIAKALFSNLQDGVLLVAGTNGKTTTSLMAKTILEHVGQSVVHNATGANLLNGIVSSYIQNADWLGRTRADIGIFEVDENSLPVVLSYITPRRIALLNLFRDQLDRYGEVDVIVEKWQKAISNLPKSTELIINSDDPGVSWLGKSATGKVVYFGVNEPKKYLKEKEHATDSAFCPACGERLVYDGVYYSHIGVWHCGRCENKRPNPQVHDWPGSLTGLYNRYNTLAAVALCTSLGITKKKITQALTAFSPAFGRQEEVEVDGKKIALFLSKNPTSFNASLRVALEKKATHFLFVLNDRIPDGRDVSWIWDVDFETLPQNVSKTVSGDRVYDMALRLKYTQKEHDEESTESRLVVEPTLEDAIKRALARMTKGQTLFVLPTYSGMLEVRKIITGKKIL